MQTVGFCVARLDGRRVKGFSEDGRAGNGGCEDERTIMTQAV